MPTAADLRRASEVVVIRGAGFDPKHRQANVRLFSERDAEAVAQIAELRCDAVRGTEGDAFMEWPTVSFVFLEERRVVGEIGLLAGGGWARRPDRLDLKLHYPQAVHAWLRVRGVEVP